MMLQSNDSNLETGFLMDIKTKNWLTALVLGLLALSFYVYAMPQAVRDLVVKAVKSIF
jgi:hypothetical protein